MVDIRENNQMQEKSTTPETITTSMILEDLENGIDRTGIKTKYNLEAWEVKQMFDHPVLKGKKAKRVKKLSFTFLDDTVNTDPDQLDLEDAIADELEGRSKMDAQDIEQTIREESEEADEIFQSIDDVTESAEEMGVEKDNFPSKPSLSDNVGDFDGDNLNSLEARADDWSNKY
jgi:hypothetical protein